MEVEHDYQVTPIDFEGHWVKGILKKAFPLNCLRMPVRSLLILTFSHLKPVEYIALAK
jgi:hypothetical protein